MTDRTLRADRADSPDALPATTGEVWSRRLLIAAIIAATVFLLTMSFGLDVIGVFAVVLVIPLAATAKGLLLADFGLSVAVLFDRRLHMDRRMRPLVFAVAAIVLYVLAFSLVYTAFG